MIAQRYAQIAHRYRQRFGRDPEALPSDRLEATNVLRRMVAELNGKSPGTIRRGDPCHVADADEVRAARELEMEEAKRGSGPKPSHPAQHPNGRRNRYSA